MLVVDRSIYAQYGADGTGIDFMQLSADLIREHRLGSTPSILDSEATSKGMSLSPSSLGVSPPAYDDIYGSKLNNWDLPPSYSQLSIMLQLNCVNSNSDERRTDDEEIVDRESEL